MEGRRLVDATRELDRIEQSERDDRHAFVSRIQPDGADAGDLSQVRMERRPNTTTAPSVNQAQLWSIGKQRLADRVLGTLESLFHRQAVEINIGHTLRPTFRGRRRRLDSHRSLFRSATRLSDGCDVTLLDQQVSAVDVDEDTSAVTDFQHHPFSERRLHRLPGREPGAELHECCGFDNRHSRPGRRAGLHLTLCNVQPRKPAGIDVTMLDRDYTDPCTPDRRSLSP